MSKTVKYLGLTPEQQQSLLSYLGTRPYNEVAQGIQELSNLPTFDVTISEQPTQETEKTPE